MKAIDMQAEISTEKVALSKDSAVLAMMARQFKTQQFAFRTEEEMVKDFRDADVKLQKNINGRRYEWAIPLSL